MGWRGESHNHGLCAKGIKVRSNKSIKKFTKNSSVEVRWDGGSKKLSLESVSRENINRAIQNDRELLRLFVDEEKPFQLYRGGEELII